MLRKLVIPKNPQLDWGSNPGFKALLRVSKENEGLTSLVIFYFMVVMK